MRSTALSKSSRCSRSRFSMSFAARSLAIASPRLLASSSSALSGEFLLLAYSAATATNSASCASPCNLNSRAYFLHSSRSLLARSFHPAASLSAFPFPSLNASCTCNRYSTSICNSFVNSRPLFGSAMSWFVIESISARTTVSSTCSNPSMSLSRRKLLASALATTRQSILESFTASNSNSSILLDAAPSSAMGDSNVSNRASSNFSSPAS